MTDISLKGTQLSMHRTMKLLNRYVANGVWNGASLRRGKRSVVRTRKETTGVFLGGRDGLEDLQPQGRTGWQGSNPVRFLKRPRLSEHPFYYGVFASKFLLQSRCKPICSDV
jgi:hypothetical protein